MGQNKVRNIFDLLKLGFKKYRKRRKSLFALLPVANVKFIQEHTSVSSEGICMEESRLLVTCDESLSCLNHDGHVALRPNVKICVAQRRDTLRLYNQLSLPRYISRRRTHCTLSSF